MIIVKIFSVIHI